MLDPSKGPPLAFWKKKGKAVLGPLTAHPGTKAGSHTPTAVSLGGPDLLPRGSLPEQRQQVGDRAPGAGLLS